MTLPWAPPHPGFPGVSLGLSGGPIQDMGVSVVRRMGRKQAMMEVVVQRRPRSACLARILYALTMPETAEVFLVDQLRHLRDLGHEVHFAASPDGERLSRVEQREGAIVHAIPMARAIRPWQDLAALFRVGGLLARVRPDVLNYGTPKAALLFALAAWFLRVPRRVYTVHGLRWETSRGLERALLRGLEGLVCRLSTAIICVSPSLRERLGALLPSCRPRMTLLARGSCNGIDVEAMVAEREALDPAALRGRHGFHGGDVVFGFVGRMAKDKGVVDLVEVFLRLAEVHPGIRLLLVGPPEPTDPLPEAVLEAIQAHPRIHDLGPRADVVAMYSLMDVYVLPSYREGLPYTPLEAATLFLPVITTTATGARDTVVAGETGWLFPPGDQAALQRCMEAALADPEGCRAMGLRGHARIRTEFHRRAVWNDLEKVLCGGPGASLTP